MRNHHEENLKLLRRIRAGDETARSELKSQNKGLVFWHAKKIMGPRWDHGGLREWQEREEIVSRGFVGLCAGAAVVESIRHGNVGAYLGSWIRGEMLKGEDALISNLPKPRPGKPGIVIFQQFDHEMDRRPTMRLDPHARRNRYVDFDPQVIFWDEQDYGDTLRLIRWLCMDGTDDAIVDLRLDGQTIPEVARSLALTEPAVRKRLRRLERDFWRVRRRGTSYQV